MLLSVCFQEHNPHDSDKLTIASFPTQPKLLPQFRHQFHVSSLETDSVMKAKKTKTLSFPKTIVSSQRISPNSSQRALIVEPSPIDGGAEAALPQVSRFGRILPSTLEFRAHGATVPCLAYGKTTGIHTNGLLAH